MYMRTAYISEWICVYALTARWFLLLPTYEFGAETVLSSSSSIQVPHHSRHYHFHRERKIGRKNMVSLPITSLNQSECTHLYPPTTYVRR